MDGFNKQHEISHHARSHALAGVGVLVVGVFVCVGLVYSTPVAVADISSGTEPADLNASENANKIVIAVNVPFSEAELAHALYVRGVVWAKQIRVRLSPAGRVSVDADGSETEVELDGRVGAAAARVVAVSLVGVMSSDTPSGATVADNSLAMTTPPAANSPPLGGPSTVPVTRAATAQTGEPSRNWRWLSISPVLGTRFTGVADGETLGFEASLDLYTRKYVRVTGAANILSVRIRVPTDDIDYVSRDRPITARLGLSIGPEWLNASAGPRVTRHFYSGICGGHDEVVTSFFGSVRGLWKFGDRFGLTANITHYTNDLGAQQSAQCFFATGFAPFTPERPNLEISAGFAISL